ncbi:MAG: MBL fold metallo-hydrolase [Methanomicrobiales archaeon]
MTSLDFYGGVDEIGGNKILTNFKDTSLFLDFGMSFSQANKYFAEFLQPRKANGILDFIEFGLLPDIKGIYREDYLKHSGLHSTEEPSVDGVLISHAHMDHSSYVHHLREDIPLFLTEQSYLIMKVLENTTSVTFTDLITLKKDFHFIPKKRVEGYKRLQGDLARVKRDIKVMKPYHNYDLGSFSVKSAPVDHSLPGATGFILENSEDAIIYTGDLRFHGRRPELTKKFVKEAKKVNPTVMLSEGTRIDEASSVTEEDIEKNATNLISNYHGLVVINYPIRDLDRLLTFYEVACNVDRKLVVNLKQAYMLNLFYGKGYPKIDDVVVYVPRKGWGLLGEDSYACFGDEWTCSMDIDQYHVKTDYDKWERDFLDWDNTINYKDLRDEPENYIFRCDFFELKELIDIKPREGIYIRSVTEPFDDEMVIDYQKAKNWLDHFNLKLIEEGMHASGHANGTEILNMIRQIAPEKVYPIHTVKKEEFHVLRDEGIKVVDPKLSL